MQFLQTQGPSGPGWNGGMSLRFCAPKMLCPDQGVTLVMGSGADSPCQGEMARRARGGRVGDYEHEVLIGAVPGGVLFNLPCLPAKPSTAGSPGRGGARERAQFSPSGGNGDKRTLRRRAAMGKGTRRPQAAKFPEKRNLIPDCGGKVILRRFGPPDEPGGAVLTQEHLRRAEAAVVLIAHGVAVGTGVVDDQ